MSCTFTFAPSYHLEDVFSAKGEIELTSKETINGSQFPDKNAHAHSFPADLSTLKPGDDLFLHEGKGGQSG